MKTILAFLLAVVALLSSPALAAESANEVLFEQCKAYKRIKAKREGVGPAELYEANSCVRYMAGAFQMHNLSTNGTCAHSEKNVDQFIEEYLEYSRKGGGFLDRPQQVVVWTFLESCYCGKNDAIMRSYCPAPSK